MHPICLLYYFIIFAIDKIDFTRSCFTMGFFLTNLSRPFTTVFLGALLVLDVSSQEFGPCDRDNVPETGFCIDASQRTCSVTTLFGKCPGGNEIRCCPEPGGLIASQCVAQGGLCKPETNCFFGTTVAGLCPGPSGIKCCIPDPPAELTTLLSQTALLHEKVDSLQECCNNIPDPSLEIEELVVEATQLIKKVDQLQVSIDAVEDSVETVCAKSNSKKSKSKSKI